jgi:DNA-binding NarL/FixJ family response regulator
MEEKLQSLLLSMREVRILRLVKAGLKNKEIAEELKIQISTVKSHLMRKLGLKGKGAINNFLLSPTTH